MESKVYDFSNKRIPKMKYCQYTPKPLRRGKQYPLIVFLHGAGERGEDLDAVYKNALPALIRDGLSPDAFVICPQCPDVWIWNLLTVELKELIDHAIATLPVDPDRVLLTGISMGGYGTWEMGMSFPGFFAALAPVCGGGVSWRVPLIGKTPVFAVHGDADTTVPVGNSIELCDRLAAAGGNVQLTIAHGVAHNSWDFAYGQTKLIEWLLLQNRRNNI